MSRRRRSRVAGKPCQVFDDDDGLSKLECFLRDYTRVTRDAACQRGASSTPAVWLYKDNEWAQLEDGKVEKIMNAHESVCSALDDKLFESNSFDDRKSVDVVGIYEHNENKGQFAIVAALDNAVSGAELAGYGFLGSTVSTLGLILADLAIRPLFRSHRVKMMAEYYKAQASEDEDRQTKMDELAKKIIAWDWYRLKNGRDDDFLPDKRFEKKAHV